MAPATAAYYAATGESHLSGAASPTKYQENGHDTFSDFDINLAYELGIGENYETWRFDDANRTRESRVKVEPKY